MDGFHLSCRVREKQDGERVIYVAKLPSQHVGDESTCLTSRTSTEASLSQRMHAHTHTHTHTHTDTHTHQHNTHHTHTCRHTHIRRVFIHATPFIGSDHSLSCIFQLQSPVVMY